MDEKEAKAYARSSTAYPQPVQRRRGPLIILSVAAFIFFTIFFSTSSVQGVSNVAKDAAQHIPAPHLPSFPEFHNPFRSSAAHEPPVQKNSSSGDTKWYSDWQWLNPFSSSVTLDDTRSVLPPLKVRPPIYTYYDAQIEKEAAIAAEEKKLLTLWRRAWWAQGFKPVILGPAEAMKNPLYETMQTRKLEDSLKNEIMRWLAWGHMGTGILANWLAIPMGSHGDDDLTYLRRAQYPKLTRYETLGNGVFLGTDTDINSAIQAVLDLEDLEKQRVIWEAIPRKTWDFEPKPVGIAFYDMQTLKSTYGAVADEIQENKVKGLVSLQHLMTSHLHGTFLSQYPEGIAVLNSQGLRSTILTGPGIIIANSLNTCPESPVPNSCPPNLPKCKPCGPMSVAFPQTVSNSTKLFTIGTIPHPYTLSLLIIARPEIDVAYVRRQQERDVWLLKVTADTLDSRFSAYDRIVTFKDTIANDKFAPHSLWSTAERDHSWKDLEWHLGFALKIPEDAGTTSKDASPTIKLPEPNTDEDPPVLKDLLKSLGTKRPTRQGLVQQAELVKKSREVLSSEKFKGPVDMRKVVEAWHLADTEAWRFVRALEARELVERQKWEEEEKRFVGSPE